MFNEKGLSMQYVQYCTLILKTNRFAEDFRQINSRVHYCRVFMMGTV